MAARPQDTSLQHINKLSNNEQYWSELELPNLDLQTATIRYPNNGPFFATRKEAMAALTKKDGSRPHNLSYQVTGITSSEFERVKVSVVPLTLSHSPPISRQRKYIKLFEQWGVPTKGQSREVFDMLQSQKAIDFESAFYHRLAVDYPFLRIGDSPSHWQAKLLFTAIQNARGGSRRYQSDKSNNFKAAKLRKENLERKRVEQIS